MAFSRPTLAELVTRVEADFESRLDLVGTVLRRATAKVLSRVVAGATHMLHGHLEFLGRQIFPDLSEAEFLVRQAALFGLAKTSPTFATATATATGTNAVPIPAGSLLIRSDGVEYTVDEDATISGGTAVLALTAVLAGADGTLTAGVVVTFESPILGVDSDATVIDSTVDGSDEETTEELRVRLLEHLAEPAHGGSAPDYVAWAKQVAGVTRAWVTALGLGPGTVVVRFVRDDDVSPIPDAGEVTEVQTYLDTVAPAHATVTVVAPVAAPLNFTLSVTPDTSAVRAAVTAEIGDMILRLAEPGGTILLSTVRTTIGNATGLTDYSLAAPAADATHTANQFPTLGSIAFT